MVINTGNANAGTGADGLARRADLRRHWRPAGLQPEQVLPFSTGVIMEPLPVERIEAGLPAAMADAAGQPLGARRRRHHDHRHPAQGLQRQVQVGGATVTVTGISKGAGMIRPNMATMLGFMATDACRATPAGSWQAGWPTRLVQPHHHRWRHQHQRFLRRVATTRPATHPSPLDSPEGQALCAALLDVARSWPRPSCATAKAPPSSSPCAWRAARRSAECKQVAYAIAHSPLVKTAFFASDPNLGRILAAVGYAGIADLDQT
jgi:glutamate N-acetyltransferase/amino-acid N-acetyltransferase